MKTTPSHFLTEEDMLADDVDARVALAYPDPDEDEDNGCYFLTARSDTLNPRHELAFS